MFELVVILTFDCSISKLKDKDHWFCGSNQYLLKPRAATVSMDLQRIHWSSRSHRSVLKSQPSSSWCFQDNHNVLHRPKQASVTEVSQLAALAGLVLRRMRAFLQTQVLIMNYNIILYYIMLYYIILYHIILYYIILYYIILYYIIYILLYMAKTRTFMP